MYATLSNIDPSPIQPQAPKDDAVFDEQPDSLGTASDMTQLKSIEKSPKQPSGAYQASEYHFAVISEIVVSIANQYERLLSDFCLLQNKKKVIKTIEEQMSKLADIQLHTSLCGYGLETLHDFVDQTSIDQLLLQVTNQLNQIKLTFSSIHNITTSIEMDLESLNNFICLHNQEHIRSDTNQASSFGCVLESSELLLNDLRDQLSDIQLSDEFVWRSEYDATEVTSKLFDLLNTIESSMRTKSTIDDETTTKQNLQNQISELLQINLSKVEKELVLKQSQLNAIESNFSQLYLRLMDDLEELHRLTVWYESFIKAYFELPAEIERRKQQQKQDQQAIRVFQQRLDQMAAEEERRQRAFESNFGRFLPDNLCPSIKVPPVRFRIVGDKKPPDLPDLPLPETCSISMKPKRILVMSQKEYPTHQLYQIQKSSSPPSPLRIAR